MSGARGRKVNISALVWLTLHLSLTDPPLSPHTSPKCFIYAVQKTAKSFRSVRILCLRQLKLTPRHPEGQCISLGHRAVIRSNS